MKTSVFITLTDCKREYNVVLYAGMMGAAWQDKPAYRSQPSGELCTEEGAIRFMESEWSRDPIKERYDWLYRYDVETAEI